MTKSALPILLCAASAFACSSESSSPAPSTPNTNTCLFCNDFEAEAAGAVSETTAYTPVTSNGTLTIDNVHARGTQALHVHTEGNGRAYISLKSFAPPSNSFWGRAYVWVDAFPTAPNYAHYTLVEAEGTPSGATAPMFVRPIGGQYIQEESKNMWGPGSDGGNTGDWTNWHNSAPAESGKWLCMEWEMLDANDSIRVWIDGVEKNFLAVSTQSHLGEQVPFEFPTFTKLWLGWWLYQAGPTPDHYDIWLDDIAIAPERQPCK